MQETMQEQQEQEQEIKVYVSSLLEKGLTSLIKDATNQLVYDLAREFGFDLEAGLKRAEMLLVSKQVKAKKEKEQKQAKAKKEKEVKTKKEKQPKTKKEKEPKQQKQPKEKVVKRVQPCYPVPFDNHIFDDCCFAVKPNSGLWTQCMNAPATDSEFCTSCTKKGQPTLTINQRGILGDMFVDPKGNKPTHYTKIMKKLNITEADVKNEMAKFGYEISEKHFILSQTKRGRPKKDSSSSSGSNSDSESGTSNSNTKEAKKSGRPKKNSKVVQLASTEDLFATLISEAKTPRNAQSNAQSNASKAIEETVEVEIVSEISASEDDVSKKSTKSTKSTKSNDKKEVNAAAKKFEQDLKAANKAEEKSAKVAQKEQEKNAKAANKAEEKNAKVAKKEQSIVLKSFKIKGVKYLKNDATNEVYDRETTELIGTWNESNNSIVALPTKAVVEEKEEEEEEEELDTEDEESESESESESDNDSDEE